MPRILVVEDDEEIGELLEQAFALEGYEFAGHPDAESVEAALKRTAPDVALLDINLPGEHGVSLAWRLRNQWPDVPIVIMSSALESWETDDLTECGVDAVIAKPFNLERLIAIVKNLVDNGRPNRKETP